MKLFFLGDDAVVFAWARTGEKTSEIRGLAALSGDLVMSHFQAAVLAARVIRAFKKGRNLARTPEIELLCVAFGERNISRVIKLRPTDDRILAVFLFSNRKEAIRKFVDICRINRVVPVERPLGLDYEDRIRIYRHLERTALLELDR